MTERATDAAITRGHIAYVEGLRAVAALVVFLNHAYAQAFYFNYAFAHPDGVLSFARYSMVTGHLSVTIFIVISGFCLTLPVVAGGDRLRGGTVGFAKRRIRRILPAYYGSLALSLALIWTVIGQPTGTLWDVPIYVTPESIVSHLLLLQDLFGTSKINYVLWSIAVEWHLYFVFPVLVWSWRRFGPASTVTAAMVLGYTLFLTVGSTRVGRANPHYLGMFALGMLGAYAARSSREGFRRWREVFPWRLTAAAAALVTATLIVRWDIELAEQRMYVLDLFVGVMAASLLVLMSRPEGTLVARVLSWKPLVTIGTFSYSLYLIHAPLLQLLWQYLLRPSGASASAIFIALMTGGLAFVLGAAYLFYRVFEEPFMRPSSSVRREEQAVAPAPGLGVV